MALTYLMGIDVGGTVKAAITIWKVMKLPFMITFTAVQFSFVTYEVKDMSLKAIKDVIEKAGIQDGKREILSIGITGQRNGSLYGR